LLDSYDSERRPVFGSTIDDFIAKSIESDRTFLAEFDPAKDRAGFESAWNARAKGAVGEVHAFEPNYEGSPIVSGGGDGKAPSAVGSHTFDARSGHHLAPATLASGRNVYEFMGDGFVLLALDAGSEAVAAFRSAAAALSMPLTVVEAPISGEAARYAARLVLIRPDQFVAWVGHEASVDAASIEQVLEAALGGKR
jgi:hypothetical protein